MENKIIVVKRTTKLNPGIITYFLSVVGVEGEEQISEESFHLLKDAFKMKQGCRYIDCNGTSYPYHSVKDKRLGLTEYKFEVTNTSSSITFEVAVKGVNMTNALENCHKKFPEPLYKNHAIL